MIGTPYIIGGSALALVLMYGAWSIQVSNLRADHAGAMTAEKERASLIQKGWDSYKLAVEQTATDQERIRADANLKALNEREAMTAEIDRLRQQYTTAARARDEEAAALQRILNNAPKTSVSPLDPSAIAVYRRLRERQTAAGNADN